MKLNKKGWGFFQMFWMSAILLFFFLLAIVLIWRIYRSMDYRLHDESAVIAKSHEQMLIDLKAAAYSYVEYNYANKTDINSIKLTDTDLFSTGLFAKDLYGDCTGYAIVSKTNGEIFTRSYIKCSDFKSVGYDNN